MPNDHCTCEYRTDIPGVLHAPSCPLFRHPTDTRPVTHEEAQHAAAYGPKGRDVFEAGVERDLHGEPEKDPTDVTGETIYEKVARRLMEREQEKQAQLGPELVLDPRFADDLLTAGISVTRIEPTDFFLPIHEIKEAPAPAPVEPTLPVENAGERKALPLVSGVLDYFPAALMEVARISKIGNEQHNPGQPLHWERSKSGDEADALLRHLVDRGLIDADGVRHSAKVAWRALALLQKELEAAGLAPISRGSWV